MDKKNDGTMENKYTMMIDEQYKSVYVGISSVIGKRNGQQDTIKSDSCSSYANNGKMISVLCDGMGGLSGGERASTLCASIVYDTFHSGLKFVSIPTFFKSVIDESDEKVGLLKSNDGAQSIKAGTTLASVVIDDNQLYWASVGDSRIYIIRNNNILCVTKDHNFSMILNEKVKRGEISREEAENDKQKEALISYIGIGGVRYIDMNGKGLCLADKDYIVLCSDGLYRSLSDIEIKEIVCCFGAETQQAAEALTSYALNKNFKNQDNTSVVVIAYREFG